MTSCISYILWYKVVCMGNGTNNTAKKESKGFWAWLAKGTSAEPWLTAEQIMKDPEFKKQQDEIKKIKQIIQNQKTINKVVMPEFEKLL